MIPLLMVPAHDVAVDEAGMRSTGSDPFFLLQPLGAPFPAGRCEFAFTAGPGTIPLQPVLYPDTGDDFNEAQSIRLAGGEAGVYRQLIDLPPGLLRLRFDPTALTGTMPLHAARLIPRQGPVAEAAARDYPGWARTYGLHPDDLREIAAHGRQLRRPAIAVWRPGQRQPRRGRHVLLLQDGDVLAPDALYRLALAASAHPSAAAFTMDSDRLHPDGAHSDPQFRAAWSPDLVHSGADIGPVMLARAALPDQATPTAIRAALLALQPAAVVHVPGILVHRPAPAPDAAPSPAPPALAEAPLVSVIVPTRDGLALLRRTLDGVLNRTDYPALEVLVLDNGSEQPDTLAYLQDLQADRRVRVLAVPGPFNYSAINNQGVAAARGEVVVLLNNDMAVIDPGWLAALVAQALRPEVGAVGAKLLYQDGTVQHAGIVTGLMGVAGHLFRGMAADAHPWLLRTRDVTAVTAACLAMRRAVFQEVGGLDAAELPVSYSDVDLCLKLRRTGYRVIWTPHATLHHLESAMRGADDRPENAARARREHDALLRRWGIAVLQDPFYSPCLALDAEDGRLAWPPRLPRPWRDHAEAEAERRQRSLPRRVRRLVGRLLRRAGLL